MHQLDTNRFSTFGNEMEQIASQRNQKPSSFRNAAFENNNYQGLSRDGSEANLRRSEAERLSLEDHASEGNENYRKESMEYLEENIPKQLQGVERSLENTGKTALSKASGSEANDLRNTLSLFFPCDYFVPESFGSTAIDNKTILEVTETEREKEKAKACPKGGNSYPMSRREGQTDIYEKSIETLRDLNKISGREGYISDRIVSLDRHSERTKMTDDSTKGRSSSCEKSYLLNEFKSLRKEVVAIQKDFKMSENYNRKLEGQIYNQNFASLKEENGALKNQLGGGALSKKTVPQPKETQRTSRIEIKDHAHIDHIVSKKANKFYREEIQFIKSKYEKIIKNHECIIKDLQNQLKMRDIELEEAKRLNNEKESKKIEESDLHCHKARSDVVSHRDLSGENGRFYTPSRSKPLAEINSSNSYDRFAESQNNPKATRSFVEGGSSTSYNHPKHTMNLLKDLQKPKEQDKENIQKDHLKRSDKKVSASKSSSSFMSNSQIHSLPYNRLPENQQQHHLNPSKISNRQSQSQRDNNKLRELVPQVQQHNVELEEDGKKSLIDISFDASYMKDNMEKRLDSELTSLNISPAKEHDWKFRSNNISQKSKKPIHNISQFNEISIIKEQPSENFITDSIQTKIFTELQSSQADSNKRCTTEEREINVYKNSLKENRGYSENREGKRKSRIYPEDYYKPGLLPVANLSKNKDYYERPKLNAENSYQNILGDQRKKSSRHPQSKDLKSERVHHVLPTHQLPGDPFEYESAEYKKPQRLSSGYQANAGGERNLKRSHNQSNEFDSQLDRYIPLPNQNNNDTIINLNNALEEMLENDQLRISHQKHKSKKESELSHKRKDQELEKLKMQSRSRSSGHQRKRSNPNSNLYIGTTVNQSSKGPLDSGSHREYEDQLEARNQSSRRNLYTPHDMDTYMREAAQDSGYLKAKRDVYSHGSQKSTTPQSRVPMSNKYRSDSSMYSQTPVVREEKLHDKKSSRGGGSSFENYGAKEYSKRDSAKYGGGQYQIGSFHEQLANDYQQQQQPVIEKNRSKDTKRQQSINDYVNFESVLQQQERGDINANQSSFALFQEKYSHTNFDSINSSTLFEAFPLRKSQAHKEGEFLIGNFTKPKYF